jgi:pimeloyl-ACP methyl ester carboxylesterase
MRALRSKLAVLAAAVALLPVLPAATATAGPRCTTTTVPVSLPGSAVQYPLWGEYCHAAGPALGLQILVHGYTYDHYYWDFPYRPEQYSYVRFAAASGFDTLDVDRLGVGLSGHPPSELLTVQSDADVLHQLVGQARLGFFGGTPPKKVLLAGHSYGGDVVKAEAATYADVDGVILTDSLHVVNPDISDEFAGLVQDPRTVPRLAAEVPPDDPLYFTLTDDSRRFFYDRSLADPAVIATDIAHKETFGLYELITQSTANQLTGQITVPVLLVVGEHDQLYCGPRATDCSSAASVLAAESRYYGPGACLRAFVLPRAGHSVNLHRDGLLWFAAASAWAVTVSTGSLPCRT